jgi:hypothetical protein
LSAAVDSPFKARDGARWFFVVESAEAQAREAMNTAVVRMVIGEMCANL